MPKARIRPIWHYPRTISCNVVPFSREIEWWRNRVFEFMPVNDTYAADKFVTITGEYYKNDGITRYRLVMNSESGARLASFWDYSHCFYCVSDFICRYPHIGQIQVSLVVSSESNKCKIHNYGVRHGNMLLKVTFVKPEQVIKLCAGRLLTRPAVIYDRRLHGNTVPTIYFSRMYAQKLVCIKPPGGRLDLIFTYDSETDLLAPFVDLDNHLYYENGRVTRIE
jgi:hypothetical protein